MWDEEGPFDGLLGFSQGAAMASLFNHCAFAGARGGGGGRAEQHGGAGSELAVSKKFVFCDVQSLRTA